MGDNITLVRSDLEHVAARALYELALHCELTGDRLKARRNLTQAFIRADPQLGNDIIRYVCVKEQENKARNDI